MEELEFIAKGTLQVLGGTGERRVIMFCVWLTILAMFLLLFADLYLDDEDKG